MNKNLKYQHKPRFSSKTAAFAIAVLLLLGNIVLPAPAKAFLGGVGPISGENGFPLWYQDESGLALELCGDPNDLLCLADPVVLGNEFSETIGFGEEAFWWNAEAQLEIAPGNNVIEVVQILPNGGKALLVLAMEAAWANEEPADGDQISFGRVRIRIDVSEAGTYTITHPFGEAVFEVTPERLAETNGIRAIDADKLEPIETNVPLGDVGCEVSPCDFGLALESGIGPFLVWDETSAPFAPEGYVGDPAVPHKVKGGKNLNKFRVEGPNIGGEGIDFVETDLFSVSGKIADTVPPVFKNIETVPETVEANGTDFFTVSAEITDNLSGVSNVFVDLSELGGRPNKADFGLESGTLLEGIWSGRVASDTAGEFIVPITAIDQSGNESVSNVLLTFTEQSLSPPTDTTPPTLTILGNNPVNVTVNTAYSDAGATALDDVDGDISDNISIGNPVNTLVAGSYLVTYTVSDSSGNTASASRTVNVVLPEGFDSSITLNTTNEWSLFSAPDRLSSIRFVNEDILAILSYDSQTGQFTQVTNPDDPELFNPLNGFFIRSARPTTVSFDIAPLNNPEIISKNLGSGLNLVGTNSQGLAKNELSQIQITPTRGGMTTLYVPQTFNGRKNIFSDWTTDGNKDLNANPIIDLPLKEMSAFDGYWVFLDSSLTFSKQRN